MHQVKTFINIFKRQCMRNQRINIDLALHIPIDNLWHIGAPTRTDTTGAVIPTDRSWSPLTAFLVLVAAFKIIIPCVSAPPLFSSASRRSRAADFSLLPADADRSHATVDDAARDSNASTRPSSSPFDLASPSAEL